MCGQLNSARALVLPLIVLIFFLFCCTIFIAFPTITRNLLHNLPFVSCTFTYALFCISGEIKLFYCCSCCFFMSFALICCIIAAHFIFYFVISIWIFIFYFCKLFIIFRSTKFMKILKRNYFF